MKSSCFSWLGVTVFLCASAALLVSCNAQKIPSAPAANGNLAVYTSTPTLTRVVVSTPTSTLIPSSTTTVTSTVTATVTHISTPTFSPTWTMTGTLPPTNTPTPTFTPTNSFTASATYTITYSPTLTVTGTPTSSPTVTNTPPSGPTVLSPGDVAILGFTTKGTENDQFAFVVLRAIGADTQINLSDMNWDGYEFSESDGGVIVWTADKAYPAGTIVQVLSTSNGSASSTTSYAVNIYSGGVTYTNTTNSSAPYTVNASSPIQVVTVANTGGGLTGLSTSGDQLIVYQGSEALGASASSVTFIGALNYGAAWSTGTPTPVPNPTWDLTYYGKGNGHEGNSYLPPGLTEGQNAIAIPSGYGNGGYYNCVNGTTGTESTLGALLCNSSNWTLSMSPADLPVPVLSCGMTVQ